MPASNNVRERCRVSVQGVVQGVGFRPYVHGLATRGAPPLTGFVRNDPDGVVIEVEGDSANIHEFLAALTIAPPPLASIEGMRLERTAPVGDRAFTIATGAAVGRQGAARIVLTPDVATCADCVRELFDPADRRYSYPFISCLHCGPRFTILNTLPYDRARTTMASFEMCAQCRSEYYDPRDRRFHAQTNACAACGPVVRFHEVGETAAPSTAESAVAAAIEALLAGDIVCVKGLGGFHLACDATNAAAVRRLRNRKHRDAKPFAVMVQDVAMAREFTFVDAVGATILESPERPIVLLEKSHPHSLPLDEIAPSNGRTGVMLPYTGLHHLLLAGVGRALVMTSGNLHGEPMVTDDADAVDILGGVADAFLLNDRAIASRCDDSVVRPRRPGRHTAPAIMRRARGYAPRAIRLAETISAPVLAVGAHLKSTFCLAADRHAVISHHIGDLENTAARTALSDTIDAYAALLDVTPGVVAHDLHPDYASTRLAQTFLAEHCIAVQHHHAHALACLTENRITEPSLAIVFDGAGVGADAAIWGGELLFVNGAHYERLGHLGYVALPGGDAATRRPWRAAASHLLNALGDAEHALPSAWADRGSPGEWQQVRQMVTKRVSSPQTSSIGRLFDAVASIIGIRDDARFEGEAAMALEAAAAKALSARSYAVEVRERDQMFVVDPAPIIRGVVADVAREHSAADIAATFHNTLRAMILSMVREASRRTGVRRVALSGGVFQNALLEDAACDALSRASFEVLVHTLVPCNDGGLALGQAVAASRQLRGG